MSLEAWKCNQTGCNGLICVENADLDFRSEMLEGNFKLDKAKCCECKKEFVLVISHAVIEVDGKGHILDELKQASITELDKLRSERSG